MRPGSADRPQGTPQAEAQQGQPQQLRLAWIIGGLVLIAGIVAWIVSTADSEQPDDGAPTPAALPAPETPLDPDDDSGGGAGDELDPAKAEQPPHHPFSMTPAAGLTDMAEVLVSVPTPYLTQGRPAMALCVAGVTFACTDVATSDLKIEATRNSVRAMLPRRFTTRNGDIHDCAADSPCELRLWVFDFRIEERNLSLDFAGGPTPPGLAVETQADDDGRLILDLPDRGYEPMLCLTGLDQACMPLRTLPLGGEDQGSAARDEAADTNDNDEPVGDDGRTEDLGRRSWRVAVEPADLVVTPRGPYSCAGEGPCEIRFVTPDGSFVEPLPVNPPRSHAEERPILAIRPSHGLAHGQSAQILISNTADRRSPLWLCAARQRLCVSLAVIDNGEPVLLRLPRVIADRHKVTAPPANSIDCAAAACELRAIVGDRLVRQSLTFGAGTGPPTAPELVITDPGPFGDGQLVAVRGRGFFGPVEPADDRVSTTIRLCEKPDAAPYECTSVLESRQGIGPDGSLDTVIRIPPSSAWRQTFDLDGSQRLACEDACWLVVEEALETPGATVPIDLIRSDHPRLP